MKNIAQFKQTTANPKGTKKRKAKKLIARVNHENEWLFIGYLQKYCVRIKLR
jgi:hypothetical protein